MWSAQLGARVRCPEGARMQGAAGTGGWGLRRRMVSPGPFGFGLLGVEGALEVEG